MDAMIALILGDLALNHCSVNRFLSTCNAVSNCFHDLVTSEAKEKWFLTTIVDGGTNWRG
jgi:hypothetical protein